MNITKCKECGCNKTAEDKVPHLERQLREQVASDLGEYLEVIGRGVGVWNYMDMMLLPKLEGLWESLMASYAVEKNLERQLQEARAEVESWKEAKGESDDTIRQIVTLVPRDPEREDIFQAVERIVAQLRASEEAREGLRELVERVISWVPDNDERRKIMVILRSPALSSPPTGMYEALKAEARRYHETKHFILGKVDQERFPSYLECPYWPCRDFRGVLKAYEGGRA